MSNLSAVGMIAAIFIAAAFFNFHVVRLINRRNIEILSGVAGGGVPITHEMRWRSLITLQVLAAGFTAALNLVMAYCFVTIGNHVVAPDVRLLAQACAWIYISLSAACLLMGPATIVSISRLLRQAEAD